MGTNSYVTKLKARLDQAITQRDHWKQLAENRNSIVVTEVCPDSRSVEEYIIDADSVRSSWRLIREYRAQIEALRVENEQLRDCTERIDAHWQSELRDVSSESDRLRVSLADADAGMMLFLEQRDALAAELRALKGQTPARFSEESAAPGIYAILYRDNWDGHGDTYYCIAQKEESGQWVHDENGAQMLQYVGDEILMAWRLDAPPAAQDVSGLVDAAKLADNVLSALVRNNQPIQTLEREYGTEWWINVDKVRAGLAIALATHRQAQQQVDQPPPASTPRQT